jgi:CO/xanthine dehydrogenase FAD-binding subunit
MFPEPFDYHDPDSTEEALALLGEYGADARVLAGGQTLVAAMNLGLARPGLIVDLNRARELESVTLRNGALRLGALARHRTLETSAEVRTACPLLAEAAALIGNARVRSRGTLGGSLAHADPAAELPAAMLALQAEFRLASRDGRRNMPAGEFFRGPLSTALREDELLVEVGIPAQPARTGWAFEEIARRPGDFAIVGVAGVVTLAEDGSCRDARLAFAGLGTAPARAGDAEALLRSSTPDQARLGEAARAAADEIEAESDALVSAAYRRHLARVLAERALQRALGRALLSSDKPRSFDGLRSFDELRMNGAPG